MPGRIPENILEEILARVDIVEVVSSSIPLKRAGRNFKACCPFHQEKTASFIVSPDKQIYHCFGCHESGNAFKFLMRYERLEFPEAVEALAKKAGVVLPEEKIKDTKAASLLTDLSKVNELAALFYENNLKNPSAKQARDYLIKRGLSEESIKLFRLGFAPDNWDSLINALRSKGAALHLLEKSGLVVAKERGGYYDRFRNRLIFPILDIKSRPIAFGARVLDDSLPKYINSPETAAYTKGNNLYGLALAKEAIRQNDFAVIVEGYLDFIVPYQHGLKNIVASLGTALTLEQVRLLKRFTQNVVMVYDADSAGELATLRSLDIFIEEEMNVRVAFLEKGFDPDTFVRQKGINAFEERIRSASGLFDYKLKVLKSKINSSSIEGKANISSLMLETINKLKNEVLKSEYTKKLAQELDIDEEAVLAEAKKIRNEVKYQNPKEVQPKQKSVISPTEKLLIKLMLEEKKVIDKIRGALTPSDFQDELTSRIVSCLFDLAEQGKPAEPHFLMNHMGDENVSRLICESIFLPEGLGEHRDKIVDECVARLKEQKLKQKKQSLQEQMKLAQDDKDEDKLNRLTEEFHCLIKKR